MCTLTHTASFHISSRPVDEKKLMRHPVLIRMPCEVVGNEHGFHGEPEYVNESQQE